MHQPLLTWCSTASIIHDADADIDEDANTDADLDIDDNTDADADDYKDAGSDDAAAADGEIDPPKQHCWWLRRMKLVSPTWLWCY